MVGLGVYFGLRSQPSAPRASTSAVATSSGDPALAPQLSAVALRGAAADQVSADTQKNTVPAGEIDRQARAAFDAHRPLIRQRCGAMIGGTPVPVGLNVSFGADGRQITRGFSEERGNARDGLLHCLQAAVPPLSIEPPGQGRRVELRVTLP